MHRWRRLIRETYNIHPTFYGVWKMTSVGCGEWSQRAMNKSRLGSQRYELLVQSPRNGGCWEMFAVMLAMTSRAPCSYNEEWAAKQRMAGASGLSLMAQSQGLSRHSPPGPCWTWQWHPNFSLIQSIFDPRDPYIHRAAVLTPTKNAWNPLNARA